MYRRVRIPISSRPPAKRDQDAKNSNREHRCWLPVRNPRGQHWGGQEGSGALPVRVCSLRPLRLCESHVSAFEPATLTPPARGTGRPDGYGTAMTPNPLRNWFRAHPIKRLPKPLMWVLAMMVRLWGWTLRTTREDPFGFYEGRTPWPVVFVVWHNRIFFTADRFTPDVRRRTVALISASRDGQHATDFIRHFGLGVVRGSSSRGGPKALRELLRVLKQGNAIVIPVDGPRGPVYDPDPGAILLASLARVPIVPVVVNAPSRWELRTWDRTQFPIPFSRITVRVGEPILFDSDANRNRDQGVAALRERMLAITDDARR